METEILNLSEHENAGKPITYFSVVHHITTMLSRSYKTKGKLEVFTVDIGGSSPSIPTNSENNWGYRQTGKVANRSNL